MSGGQTELSSVNGPRVRKTAPKKGVNRMMLSAPVSGISLESTPITIMPASTEHGVGGGEHRSQTSPVFQSEYSGNKNTTKGHSETKTRSTSEKASTSA